MINVETLKQQLENAKKLASQINVQNTIFEQTLQEAVKGAPEEDKQKLEKVRVLSIKAISLAKKGKLEEAQDVIKQFQNGG